MTKKIFHSILLVAGTVLLASLLVIMGCLYEYFGSVEKKQLRDELELAAVAVEKNGTEYLSQLSSELPPDVDRKRRYGALRHRDRCRKP